MAVRAVAGRFISCIHNNELLLCHRSIVGRTRRSSSTQAVEEPRPIASRTVITNPSHHTSDHIGSWYTLEPNTVKRLFGHGGIPKPYRTLCDAFFESSLMVRQPALSTIDYIKRSNLNLPPNKFMLYGNNGVGKTISLVHITHFLAEDGWVLVHVPVPSQWRRVFKEVVPSATNPDQYDHTRDSVMWLQHFRSQNTELLKSLQLETSEHYTWTQREATEVGQPLMTLADFGISRARFASDCVTAIIKELKQCASQDRCKVAVVIDGINSLFCPTSRYRLEDLTYLPPDRFTIFRAFLSLLQSDWKNGVIVGTIDKRDNEGERRKSYLPRYLLRQKGWEALDPFIPIPVVDYDEVEMRSAINYYLDRGWLQSPHSGSDVGRKELAALSNHNPLTFMEICKSI
ncbi:hypothetical protein Pcinc_027725 [Petrolisthes cinctipes]|uniref:Small ribosomal subunit protein mS29 n=1 Tax=Petrolisthes cinctipes TaxID=88211 RepID=A0AAE1K8D0_PETCI|nr:hypothetical protein Pcinc_027725 [Petrolisthes cinctipes]